MKVILINAKNDTSCKNSGANLVKLQIVDPGENYQKQRFTKFSKRQCYQMRRYLNYMRSAKKIK